MRRFSAKRDKGKFERNGAPRVDHGLSREKAAGQAARLTISKPTCLRRGESRPRKALAVWRRRGNRLRFLGRISSNHLQLGRVADVFG